ncbi:secreted protein containing N-terminal Zinc-dependent carboxypeptidase related [Paraglaciecola mesophila KMM 241]|uniref:Secreted protein containing N-terminal Zinc-dependent carboxypeptidase related n=1 Tax=Paraglaciecola mesophila KMM 241 TaxID=1128912 RepID=K6ZQS7_9ALTE|nr:M14 metallopeptidase family protein [Paraglaciecola mesophila]GAC25685.1 secreted protein containing N-terminal Zinc-dependent carboxypeptidase related [Paraglaciecola mesophila KMM 241]
MILKHTIKPLILGALTCISALALAAPQSGLTPFAATPKSLTKAANWPSVQYDSAIPNMQSVLGYSVGERITSHPDMLRFFEALQQAAPKQIKLFEYGETWEGRKLIYAAIGTEQNIASLGQFSTDMQALSDPRITNKSKAKNLMNTLPSSVWLEYSVHGNEISSTDAAMMTAYHLLAGKGDATVDNIMQNSIVFIDPLQNPDGRSRFIANYYSTVGMMHSSDRLSAEHNEPWPRGRANHYLFDMNRDWLAITQPETKGRIAGMNKYRPLVVIDLHEMGGDESYYFAPSAQPVNPHMTQAQIDNINLVGRNNAKHFDANGFDYFTREIFDAFYPGYGDSWPTFYGAAASTYEVASSRGEVYRRMDGKDLSYEDTVLRHFVASISTAETVANNRSKLLKDYYQYQVDAIDAGKSDKKERVFILPNKRDRAGNFKLAKLMTEHGVDVYQTTEKVKMCGETYAPGSYYIDTAQPRGRFVKTTFTQQVDMSKAFIKEQERRRKRKLGDQIYDVTGWSLPLMYNLDVNTCGKGVSGDHRLVKMTDTLEGKVTNPNATVAYIVPWGDMAAGRFLTAALQRNITLKTADRAFTLDDKKRYPAGSLIIEVAANDNAIAATVQDLAAQSGAIIDGVNTSWVTDGPSFGSNDTHLMSAPKIAMAWDDPTSSLSAGNTRFVIEQQFGYPVNAIRTSTLASADIRHYQVLILPAGRYHSGLGQAGAQNIKQWVEAGGVLITLGSATRFAADADIGLLDIKRELAIKEEGSAEKPDDELSTVPGKAYVNREDLVKDSENSEESPDFVAGILANVEVDQEHWLTAGVAPEVVGLVYGNDIFAPIRLASGKNLAWFKSEKDVLASGYLWQENKKQLAYKPFLIHQPNGNGMVIAFTQEPTTRAYLDGLNVMLMNAIFSASAHAYVAR